MFIAAFKSSLLLQVFFATYLLPYTFWQRKQSRMDRKCIVLLLYHPPSKLSLLFSYMDVLSGESAQL